MSDGTNGPVLIQGIKPDDASKPPARLEVRDMIKNQPNQWNLYLLGLERFQKSVAENNPLSYFQIAGIHGLPYTKWPDRDWNKMAQVSGKQEFGGFCTHSSILFLTWHRPYLALFEAELYKHVNAVANEFGDNERKADYVKAAKTFRMPYWDWARPDLTIFPAEATVGANNQITRPKAGKKAPINPNPLAAYKFRESASNDSINWFPDVNTTIRNPTNDNETPDEKFMRAQLSAFFQGQESGSKGRNLTERAVYILQSYNNFGGASSNRFNSNAITPNFQNWGSIEDIHNSIHVYVGGGGQMSAPPVSAFDPIFWLHHTNIDRMFAIWQAIHYDPKVASTYVTPSPAISSNFSTKTGSTESITTPLVPFAQSGTKDKQNFWTSEGARDTKSFGYVYPETQNWLFPTPTDIKKELNRIYRTASLANILASTGDEFRNSVKQLQSRADAHVESPSVSTPNVQAQSSVFAKQEAAQVPISKEESAFDTTTPDQPVNGSETKPSDNGKDLKKLVTDNKYLEWLVNIKAEKAELGGNYLVHVFLGDPDDFQPILYVTNHTHVAAFATFGQGEDTACQNCQDGRAAGLHVTGQIPLTIALVERYLAGSINSLRPEDVIPYLQKDLHWRVTLPDGQPRTRDELNNLLVSVVSNEVTIPSSPNDMPHYSDVVVPHPEATTNRDGVGRGNGTGYTGGQLV